MSPEGIASFPKIHISESVNQSQVRDPGPLGFLVVLKMLSAYYVCCICSNAIQINFIMEAKTLNPDQSAPLGAGSILSVI